jgi:hypothetical protein
MGCGRLAGLGIGAGGIHAGSPIPSFLALFRMAEKLYCYMKMLRGVGMVVKRLGAEV